MREYQNIPTRCTKQKCPFLHETVNKKIVSTHLLSDGLCRNFERYYVQNKNVGDLLMAHKHPFQAQVSPVNKYSRTKVNSRTRGP